MKGGVYYSSSLKISQFCYVICESFLICLTEPCVLENFEQAKILSVRYNKTLISGSVATAHDQDRRNVFLKRDNKTETETTESDQWVFNKIDGTNRRYRIKNLQTNEYLLRRLIIKILQV